REGLERLLVRGHRVLVPQPERQRALVAAGAAAGVGTAAVAGAAGAAVLSGAGGGAGRGGAEQTGRGEGGEEGTAVEHGGILPRRTCGPIIRSPARGRRAVCPQMIPAPIRPVGSCPSPALRCRPRVAGNLADRPIMRPERRIMLPR